MKNPKLSNRNIAYMWDALTTQGAVIKALTLRELQERYGRENIGYLWVIAEPMMLASVVTVLHTIIAKRSTDEISPFTFMLTGYCIYIIFRNTFTRAEGALHSSSSLFYHRMVTPFDILVSKSLVDTLGCMSALFVLQSIGVMLGLSELPARPLFLLGAIVIFAWWSLSLSLVIGAYGYLSPLVGRLAHPAAYFALPVSGAFITMGVLPKWTHSFMSWNPMMSIFEMARYGQFQNASGDYIFIPYVIGTIIFINYWGLLEIRRVRRLIHVG